MELVRTARADVVAVYCLSVAGRLLFMIAHPGTVRNGLLSSKSEGSLDFAQPSHPEKAVPVADLGPVEEGNPEAGPSLAGEVSGPFDYSLSLEGEG